MEASIGRIVHVVANDPALPHRAALVTKVNADGTIGCTVFFPPSEALKLGQYTAAVDNIPFSAEAVPGSWHYPERVQEVPSAGTAGVNPSGTR